MPSWLISPVSLVILALYCSRFNLNSSPSQPAKVFRDNVALYNQFFKTQEVPAEKVEALIPAAFQAIQDLLYTSPAKSTESKVWFDPFPPQVQPVTIVLHDWGADPKAGRVLGETTSPISGPMEVRIDTWIIRTSKEYTFLDFAFGASTELKIASTLFHELVHVFQHRFAKPQSFTHEGALKALRHFPPKGLVEGIADFVPLMSGRAWPAPQRPRSSRHLRAWDAGYEETAYFLEWLELVRFGKGTVGMINDRIFRVGYVRKGKDEFWKSLFGVSVKELWKEYGRHVNQMGRCLKWQVRILNRPVDFSWAMRWKWLWWVCKYLVYS